VERFAFIACPCKQGMPVATIIAGSSILYAKEPAKYQMQAAKRYKNAL